jgi:hypothetical protein
MAAKRLSITISDDDKLWLEGYCQANRISMAAAVRRGIDLLKRGERQNNYRRLVETTRGLWNKGNGLAYQQKMRTEWEKGASYAPKAMPEGSPNE